jgi:predicted NAD/FAD-dependent oxidoreductase
MKIAVVGAGIAGLAAARALVDQGHTVRVYDGASAPGGRVATRAITAVDLPRGLSGELAFDHGAQYFTVRDERFAAVVREWERSRVVAKWTGRMVSFDGEGWEDVAEGTDRYVGVPGMGAIAEAMARKIDLSCGRRIESVSPLLGDYDRLILAMPPAHAAVLVSHVPALATRIAGVRMRRNWTVMAAFDERVQARFDAAFVNASALGWIARNTSKPKRNWKIDAWVLQATLAWSDAHQDDEPDRVGAFLMEAFEDLVPAGLPRAFYATVHRWRYAAADPPLAVGAIHDPGSRITLCGDWCAGFRIEDAYLSGLAAASCNGD